jgi:hypothetical protein
LEGGRGRRGYIFDAISNRAEAFGEFGELVYVYETGVRVVCKRCQRISSAVSI